MLPARTKSQPVIEKTVSLHLASWQIRCIWRGSSVRSKQRPRSKSCAKSKGQVIWLVSEEITTPRTAFLGKLLGLYLIAVSVTMFAHPQATVEIMKAIILDRPLLFICGLMGVTAGLAIVLAHNVWSGGVLPIMVTVFGWASLIKGMLLLVLSPEMESRVFIVGLGYEQHPNFFAGFAFILGAYMAYSGFTLNTHSLE